MPLDVLGGLRCVAGLLVTDVLGCSWNCGVFTMCFHSINVARVNGTVLFTRRNAMGTVPFTCR